VISTIIAIAITLFATDSSVYVSVRHKGASIYVEGQPTACSAWADDDMRCEFPGRDLPRLRMRGNTYQIVVCPSDSSACLVETSKVSIAPAVYAPFISR
jgi:hypothetical protein